MLESLNPQELALLNSIENEYERVCAKRSVAMAMLSASHDLGNDDQIDLKTGTITRRS